MYASRGSTPVDAVVSLDTTQDYESLADHGWTEFVPVVLNSSRNMTMPILFAANAHAIFELADALVGSERDLLTFKDLHHNDFISQGLFKRMLESWSDAAGKDTPRPPPLPGSPQASYEALCEYILAFLDTRLRGDASRQAALDAKYRLNTIGGSLPHVEHIAAGATAAPPYRGAAGKPPEPRQVRGLLKERGLEATMAILKAAHQKSPDAPVFHTGYRDRTRLRTSREGPEARCCGVPPALPVVRRGVPKAVFLPGQELPETRDEDARPGLPRKSRRARP